MILKLLEEQIYEKDVLHARPVASGGLVKRPHGGEPFFQSGGDEDR